MHIAQEWFVWIHEILTVRLLCQYVYTISDYDYGWKPGYNEMHMQLTRCVLCGSWASCLFCWKSEAEFATCSKLFSVDWVGAEPTISITF